MERRLRMCLVVCATLLAGALVGTAPPAQAQAQDPWDVVTLQPLPGDTVTSVFDVNVNGYAVGMSGPGKPVYWEPNGTVHALPMGQDWIGGVAYAINDWGLIVGTKDWPAPSPGRDAVAWLYGTIIPVVDNGDALGVNEDGDIVGCANGHPFLAPLGETAQTLPTAGAGGGCALSVTDWGAVGGTQTKAFPSGNHPAGRLWYQGVGYDFNGTPQHVTEVTDVISSGWATLRIAATAGQPATHSALAAPGGPYSVFEPLASASHATGLNSYGVVVGTRMVASSTSSGPGVEVSQPVLWVYGTTVPLATLVRSADVPRVSSGSPAAINDRFMIVGNQGTGSWLMRRSGLPTTG